jgi:hypothetical protein
MEKRTSWEQKNKYIHKSRKKIIDTVFGREDNTQQTFGYEGEVEPERNIDDIWTDKDGKTWQQKEGYKISVTKFDELREYLKIITTCSTNECQTQKYDTADKKAIAKTGMCFNCLIKYEDALRADGTWPYYEDYKISKNKLGTVRELKEQYEEALKGISNQLQMINEDGTISEWKWDIDINKVKADIETDIEGATTAIELLLQRIKLLEDKFIELNHPELIR